MNLQEQDTQPDNQVYRKIPLNEFKIIQVGQAIGSRVQGVYRKANINYRGLTNGPIETLAPLATLMTRKFNTASKIEIQSGLRFCFAKHLAELQDTGSPNWQAVQAGDHGVLPWLELPVAIPVKK